MYKYVSAKTISPYKSFCSNKLNQLKMILQNQYDFDCEFELIGSGAKNLVTQNENGPFDLDYNFYITRFPDNFNPNTTEKMKWLKDTIRNELNKLFKDTAFSDAQDSTSVLTARRYFTNDPEKKLFSFDIAILKKNKNGNYCRLIHEKTFYERFFWNEVPASNNVYEKADKLKEYGWWEDVRDTYLSLKNQYLVRNDHNHPSFIVFVEAVNQVYNNFMR